MNNLLKNKNILVGVSGSIAIYKSLELIRLFIKSGANVRVVMSESAKEFVTPLTFETISQNQVLIKESESWANSNNHIATAKWADIFVIAPATANTINKIASGIADNLLLQTVLAYNKNLIIAPSANTNMYLNLTTTSNIKKLKVFGHIIVEPQKKLLACNDEGIGALADPLEIYYQTSRELLKDDFWSNRRVVVTGGGTIERIDDVRYISNFSSGKMAKALATALYLKGSDVCLIGPITNEKLPKEIYTIHTESSNELQDKIFQAIEVAKRGLISKPNINNNNSDKIIKKTPYLFMAAAVSDFAPSTSIKGKIKKENFKNSLQLELIKNRDILGTINKDGIKTVGFKAELDKENALENAKKMLLNKSIDAVCLNIIDKENGFGSDTNKITFITKDKTIDLKKDKKLNISFEILELSKEI